MRGYTARGVSVYGDGGEFIRRLRNSCFFVAGCDKYEDIQEITTIFMCFLNTLTVFFDRVYPASILRAAEYTHMECMRRKSSVYGGNRVYPAKLECIRPFRARQINSPH